MSYWYIVEQRAAQGTPGAGDTVRRVDGTVRVEEDREVLLPHALLHPRQQPARLLQEESQGQHGT
jgi:hypothetical protein